MGLERRPEVKTSRAVAVNSGTKTPEPDTCSLRGTSGRRDLLGTEPEQRLDPDRRKAVGFTCVRQYRWRRRVPGRITKPRGSARFQ
jgi:hypothetical protein